MKQKELIEKVTSIRNKKIVGDIVDLVPYSNEYLDDVLAVRNTTRAKYYLKQEFDLTKDQQLAWHDNYLKKNDDIYWVVVNKYGEFIGTTSLYNIDIQKKQAEKGRQVIIEGKALEAPYALEAEILLIKLAFSYFQIDEIIIVLKSDNKKVESMNRKFGFKWKTEVIIRGEVYNQYKLSKVDFNSEYFDKIINHWRKRHERE